MIYEVSERVLGFYVYLLLKKSFNSIVEFITRILDLCVFFVYWYKVFRANKFMLKIIS